MQSAKEIRKAITAVRRRKFDQVTGGQTASERRRLFALKSGVTDFINRHGLEKCGFLTLTFADNLRWDNAKDWATANARWNSFATNQRDVVFLDWGRVTEPQKSGRIHFHVVVATPWDIRQGFNFEEFAYRVTHKVRFTAEDVGACAKLRECWAILREVLPRYHFGRSELTPIREAAEGVASYVGKYVAGEPASCGDTKFKARRVNWARGVGKGNHYRSSTAWISKGEPWRAAIRFWRREIGPENFKAVTSEPSWAWKLQESIMQRWHAAGCPGCLATEGRIKGLVGLPDGWKHGTRVLVLGAAGSAVAEDLSVVVKDLRASGVSVVRLDADTDRGLVGDLGLLVVPSVVVLRDGEELGRFCGSRDGHALAAEALHVLGVVKEEKEEDKPPF